MEELYLTPPLSDDQLTECSVAAGAKLVLDESTFPEAKEGTALVGPQVLTNVDHSELVQLVRVILLQLTQK